MTLYLLRPIKPWQPWFDKAFGFIVRAASEEEARLLASKKAGDEGAASWTDATLSTCEPLDASGTACVIMTDFARA